MTGPNTCTYQGEGNIRLLKSNTKRIPDIFVAKRISPRGGIDTSLFVVGHVPIIYVRVWKRYSVDDSENYYTDPCSDFPFDATNEEVYTFLDSFINEISNVFTDNYLHMGGDEVKQICWATKDVLLWMQQHNMTDFSN